MSRGLDWKWIGLGVVIIFGLNFIAGAIIAVLLGNAVLAFAGGGAVALTGGQIALIAVISFLSYAVGGFIVGVRSTGRTILEPGISAVIAVVLGLLIQGGLTPTAILVGGVVPFLAGLLGGWLGERRQGTA